MILVDQLVAICRSKFGNSLLATDIPSLVDDLLQCVDIHDFSVKRLKIQKVTTPQKQPWDVKASSLSYFTVAQ